MMCEAFRAVAAGRRDAGVAAVERLLAIAEEARRTLPVIEPQALVLAADVARRGDCDAALDAARRAR